MHALSDTDDLMHRPAQSAGRKFHGARGGGGRAVKG